MLPIGTLANLASSPALATFNVQTSAFVATGFENDDFDADGYSNSVEIAASENQLVAAAVVIQAPVGCSSMGTTLDVWSHRTPSQCVLLMVPHLFGDQ